MQPTQMTNFFITIRERETNSVPGFFSIIFTNPIFNRHFLNKIPFSFTRFLNIPFYDMILSKV